jgi:predicted nucleic acid-binding protein
VALTVLDAGVVIALLDANDAHHLSAKESLRECWERHDDLVVPASAYAEMLVDPYRHGEDAVATVDSLLDSLPARIEPISRSIAAQAARLRAEHNALRLPDALVIATAIAENADLPLAQAGPARRRDLRRSAAIEVLLPSPGSAAARLEALVRGTDRHQRPAAEPKVIGDDVAKRAGEAAQSGPIAAVARAAAIGAGLHVGVDDERALAELGHARRDAREVARPLTAAARLEADVGALDTASPQGTLPGTTRTGR